MKISFAILGCWIAAAAGTLGQAVSVDLTLDQDKFLPGESILVGVRVTNFSGRNLVLGKDDSWLTFSVENAERLLVNRRGSPPVTGQFTLEPSRTGTRKVDLAPYFDFTGVGRYYVTATLHLPEWGATIQSRPATADIVKGIARWEKEFGVPARSSQDSGIPELRKYAVIESLQSTTIKLYFRLTDAQDNPLKIFPLGPMVSFSSFEPQLDSFSNLHLLYQSGGRMFTHCVVNPDGVLIARESYQPGATRPLLRAEADGRITIQGGVRHANSSDLPPPVNSTVPTNAKPGQP